MSTPGLVDFADHVGRVLLGPFAIVTFEKFPVVMSSSFFSPERIASAYELLGGTFLDEHHDSQKALQYWRAACDERERAGLSKQIQVEDQTSPPQ